MKKILIIALSSVAMLTSCKGDGWRVDGHIDNAPDSTKVAIEGLNAGIWYNIDSVEIDRNGNFSYTSPEGSPYPDIYRVSLGGKSIYFPIDSLEHITVSADAADFGREFTLSGSDLAVAMMNVDKEINAYVAANGIDKAVTDSVFKRGLSETIKHDNTGVLAYYLINKTLGDKPIYSSDNRQDVRILGAIANKFETMFPDDPRTQYLKDRFIKARKAMGGGSKRVVEADVTGLLDMEFYDVDGRSRKLSDVAKNAGVTLLSFTSYASEPSVAYNVELNRLYELFKANGIAIYQVAIDDNEVEWRNAARNLPWVAVRCSSDQAVPVLGMYSVGVIPTTFVVDRNSDIVARVDCAPAGLEAAIRKHL